MDDRRITRRTPLADLPELLTVPEAGAWLNVGRNTAYAMARQGSLPSVRLGRLLRVPRTALEAFSRRRDG